MQHATIPYVSEEALQVARKVEEEIAGFPANAGILFVSVRPEKAIDGGPSEFQISVGIASWTRQFAVAGLIDYHVAQHHPAYRFTTTVHAGKAGKASQVL